MRSTEHRSRSGRRARSLHSAKRSTRAGRLWWGVVAVTVFLASACGSTAGRRGGSATEVGLDSVADTVDGASQAQALDGQQVAADSVAVRSGARAQAGAAGPGGRTAAPAGDASPGAPAGDRKPVELGIYLYDSESTGALFTGFGYEGGWGDSRKQAEIFVKHLNRTGGILGHPIKPVIYEADLARGADTNDQEACALFTQDHHVIAVVANNPNPNEVMLKCLKARNVPMFDANLTAYADWTDRAYNRYPLFAHSGVSWDRLAGPFVNQLVASKYFSRWDTTTGAPGSAEMRIGVMAPDNPQGHEVVDKHLGPALARHGYRFHAKAFPGTEDYANVVVQFRNAGITHVFPMGLGPALFFTPQAESQRYRPRYAMNTTNWPLGLSGGMVPEGQLSGALGVGWAPPADVPPARRPDPSPTAVTCTKMMTDGGEDMSSDVASISAFNICEAGWLHRAAFAAGGGLTHQHWLAGLESLGASFVSIETLGAFYGRGQHDGVAAVRRLAYGTSCSCFEYKSGNIKV